MSENWPTEVRLSKDRKSLTVTFDGGDSYALAAEYLRARSLPVEGLAIKVSAEKAASPARLSAFHVELDAPGGCDEKHREGLVRAVKKCLIHNTLLHSPEIEILANARPAVVTALTHSLG